MSTSNRLTPNEITAESKQLFRKEAEEVKDMDFLGVDTPIPGQNWVCLSFLSPESLIKNRYLYYFQMFLKSMTQKIELPVGSEKKSTTKLEELASKDISYELIHNAWEDFLHANREQIAKKYEEETGGRTSVRGLKVRGTYSTWQEAKMRSDRLAELDKSHHVYIGQVGYWLPWDPDPSEVPEQEYQNKELNLLMKKYEENLACKDRFYEERKREKIRKAMEENKKIKEENKKEKSKDSEENKESKESETKEDHPQDMKQTMEDLDKIRKIVQEKNEILQKTLEKKEIQKKKEEEQKLLDEARGIINHKKNTNKKEEHSSESSELNKVQNVFHTDDPWLQRKKQNEPKKVKKTKQTKKNKKNKTN